MSSSFSDTSQPLSAEDASLNLFHIPSPVDDRVEEEITDDIDIGVYAFIDGFHYCQLVRSIIVLTFVKSCSCL